jgi:hypothetical protein
MFVEKVAPLLRGVTEAGVQLAVIGPSTRSDAVGVAV